MAVTTINAYPLVAGSNAPDGPGQINALANAVDKRSVAVFANDAARDAAIPSPTVGMMCVSAGRLLLYRQVSWGKVGGVRELAYENGNIGTSGVVNVGAGQVSIFSVSVPATGVVADTGHVHAVVGLKSTGTSVGNVALTVNGVSMAGQIFNLDSATSIPVVLEMPVTIPSIAFTINITVAATLGSSLSMSYGSLRVTY